MLKFRSLIIIAFAAAAVFAAGSLFQGAVEENIACAETTLTPSLYYSEAIECSDTRTRECPVGTTPLQNIDTADTSTACVRLVNNEFCQLMTGNHKVFALPTNFGGTYATATTAVHCESQVISSIGYCTGQGTGKLVITGQLPQRIVDVFTEMTRIYDPNYQGSEASVRAYLERTIMCSQIHEIGQGYYIKVPNAHESKTQSYIDDIYKSSVKQRHFALASRFGLILWRNAFGVGWNNESFCSAENSLLVSVGVDGRDGREIQKCYEGIGVLGSSRPCSIELPLTNGARVCALGFKESMSNAGAFHAYYYSDINIFTRLCAIGGDCSDLLSTNIWDHIETTDNMNACKKNGVDMLRQNSNKGCSSFVSYDYQKNTFTVQDQYESCVKCLYSGDTITQAGIDKRIREGVSNPGVSAGDQIIPDNEIFADGKPGFIYSEATGCLETGSPGRMVSTILRIALGLMGVLVILRIIQGAITMQKGDPEGFQEGKEIITSALIGLLTLILAAAILNFLGVNLLGLNGFTPYGSST